MCDYCGCRTRTLLAQLAEDHERIEALTAQIRGGSRTALDELVALLAQHSEIEEGALYPELAAEGIDVTDLYAEHHHVEATLVEAGAHGINADTLAALSELATHISREEYDLFGAAHQLLSDSAWDRIEEHRHKHAHRHDLPHQH